MSTPREPGGQTTRNGETPKERLRTAIWQVDPVKVGEALSMEPGIVNEPMAHPRWGGRPVPIQLAAERGDTRVIELLLQNGADPNHGADSYGGWCALHLAAHWGHLEAAALLRERGATVDLHAVCLLDDVSAVRAILAESPEAAVRPDLGGVPPLHVAMSVETAGMLLDHNAQLNTVDSEGNTPLGAALSRGERCREVAEFLIACGAPVDPCQLAALGMTEELRQVHNRDGGVTVYSGMIGVHAVVGTSLHAAVQHGREDTVRALLDWGADANARADSGQTPLHLCETREIAEILVEAGADPTATDDEHGTTPLVWAEVGIEIHGPTTAREALVTYLKGITPEQKD